MGAKCLSKSRFTLSTEDRALLMSFMSIGPILLRKDNVMGAFRGLYQLRARLSKEMERIKCVQTGTEENTVQCGALCRDRSVSAADCKAVP